MDLIWDIAPLAGIHVEGTQPRTHHGPGVFGHSPRARGNFGVGSSPGSSQCPPTRTPSQGYRAPSMKVLLLTAPGVSPADTPWMGVPQLLAYLKQRGYPDISQRDLDLDLFDWTLGGGATRSALEILSEQSSNMSAAAPWWKRAAVRFLGAPLLRWLSRRELAHADQFLEFRAATPVGEFFPEEGQQRYRRTLNGVLKLYAAVLYPHLAYPKFFDHKEEQTYKKLHVRAGNYLFETMDLGNRVMRAFYQQELIPDLVAKDYDVIGISVQVQRQFDAALLLARTLREAGLRAKLVMGGSFVSNTNDSGWLDDSVVSQVDYVVLYEGEQSMTALLGCIERGEEPKEVINLTYIHEGKRVETPRDFLRDINDLPAPDYDGLPLARYLDRPLRLPIMGNRGCYWGKCTFCVHFWTLGTGRMRLRSAENQLSDMKTLMSKYGTNTFYFTDEAIELEEAGRLADMILAEGLDVNWSSMVRFEETLTDDALQRLRSAGFYLMLFGLESINQRVQDIIKKGIDVETVWKVLRGCKTYGIKVNLFMILGIPGETEEEMRENVEFMRNQTDLFDNLQITVFELFKSAPMERRPEDYGIEDTHITGDHLQVAYNEIDFKTTQGLSREEVAAWKRKVDRDELLFEKEMWSGNGYRLFHPDRPMPEGTRIVVLKPTPGEGERDTKPGAEAETLQARPEPALGGDERETAERN